MADPKLYLPPVIPEINIRNLMRALDMPEPIAVSDYKCNAEYHSIYAIKFQSADIPNNLTTEPHDGLSTLLLRVAGKHYPTIKTQNEVAVMRWVKSKTSIPIPTIVAFDHTENNPIGFEYTLLECLRGTGVDAVYRSFGDAKLEYIVKQIARYLNELHAYTWGHAGGLAPDPNTTDVIPGRVVAENFWQAPEIAQWWGPGETVDSLNPRGPYENYTSYVKGFLEQYIRNIQRHESLSWMRDMIPRLEALNSWLQRSRELNDTTYVLTHEDLHLGNILCDERTDQITGILDWEFAKVLPLPLWSPGGGGFLWNCECSPEAKPEQQRLQEVFKTYCSTSYPHLLLGDDIQEPHRSIAVVLNYIRAIVEVCPRNQRHGDRMGWREKAEEALRNLGV
ncbi:kinase-like domain-containing protein [Hypoxylon crocopeplum]|nr:kinase-like domain-containing protein [Hypoxylon crocopeplum]